MHSYPKWKDSGESMMKSDDELGTSYDKVKVSWGNEILNGFQQPCGIKIIQVT